MSDTIYREDAIKALSEAFGECEPCDKEETIDIAVTTVKEIPSADRPQGWNLLEEYPSLFECSVCGASCDDTYPWDCDIKFCPNCGADMRGEQDG